MSRLTASVAVAAVGAVILWVATSLNTIVVIGFEFDYLSDGRFPLYPTIPVTYLSLSLLALPIIGLYALATALAAFAGHRWPIWPVLGLMWLGAGWIAAGYIAFEFQADFGTTWTTSEAISRFFYRHYITAPLAVIGLVIFLQAARRILRPRKHSFL